MLTRLLAYAPKVFKAITAAAFAASAAYAGAVDGGVTAEEWIVIAAGGLAAGYAVWRVRNSPATV